MKSVSAITSPENDSGIHDLSGSSFSFFLSDNNIWYWFLCFGVILLAASLFVLDLFNYFNSLSEWYPFSLHCHFFFNTASHMKTVKHEIPQNCLFGLPFLIKNNMNIDSWSVEFDFIACEFIYYANRIILNLCTKHNAKKESINAELLVIFSEKSAMFIWREKSGIKFNFLKCTPHVWYICTKGKVAVLFYVFFFCKHSISSIKVNIHSGWII